ncbi:MAG: hypothetical protein ACWA6X_11580 [Bauldia sp.]
MLTFGATAYLDRAARFSHGRVRAAVDPYLTAALARPIFAAIDARILYGPVIMAADFASRHPANFRLEPKARRYSCSPQLDHATFVTGSWEARIREYVRGLDSVPDALAKLGATDEQVDALRNILAEAPEAALTAQPTEPPLTAAEAEELRRQEEMDAVRTRLQGVSGHDFEDAAAAAMAKLPADVRAMLAARRPRDAAPVPGAGSAGARPVPSLDDDDEDASEAMPPRKIAIDPDLYHAEFVGRTADGRQFFLTTPFEFARDASGTDGNEFVALYLFDPEGALVEARIDEFGPRATMDGERRRAVHDAWLAGLGDVSIERIEIAPFAVERFGTTFGFIPREPDFDAVEVMPGNYMAFFAPWDSGEYDT